MLAQAAVVLYWENRLLIPYLLYVLAKLNHEPYNIEADLEEAYEQ